MVNSNAGFLANKNVGFLATINVDFLANKNVGFELVAEGLKINWNPDEYGIQTCIEHGKSIIEKLK